MVVAGGDRGPSVGLGAALGPRPPVRESSTVLIKTCPVDANIKRIGHAVLTEGFRGLNG